MSYPMGQVCAEDPRSCPLHTAAPASTRSSVEEGERLREHRWPVSVKGVVEVDLEVLNALCNGNGRLAASSRRRECELWVVTPWSSIIPRRLSTSSSSEGVPSLTWSVPCGAENESIVTRRGRAVGRGNPSGGAGHGSARCSREWPPLPLLVPVGTYTTI